MTNTELLTMVKSNIQMASSAFDTYLGQLVEVAKENIREYGIEVTDSIADANLIVMYASYLWDKRKSENSAMPRMLTMALRNRLFGQKMRGD